MPEVESNHIPWLAETWPDAHQHPSPRRLRFRRIAGWAKCHQPGISRLFRHMALLRMMPFGLATRPPSGIPQNRLLIGSAMSAPVTPTGPRPRLPIAGKSQASHGALARDHGPALWVGMRAVFPATDYLPRQISPDACFRAASDWSVARSSILPSALTPLCPVVLAERSGHGSGFLPYSKKFGGSASQCSIRAYSTHPLAVVPAWWVNMSVKLSSRYPGVIVSLCHVELNALYYNNSG